LPLQNEPEDLRDEPESNDLSDEHEPVSITWKEALKCKEFYLLWITRMSVVLITQVSLLS
jgi:hypothetical protein